MKWNRDPICECAICSYIFTVVTAKSDDDERMTDDEKIAAYCLLLPGKKLFLTPLLAAKKFRNRGNKDGAVRAFELLEEQGLGQTFVVGATKGTTQVKLLWCSYFV